MKLYSHIFGEGKPFLILHGFLGMGDNWKTFGKSIVDYGYQPHLVDQRNHGRSPHSKMFNYDLMSNDLYEYCQDNNLDKIDLLGHSMGGKTAMLFAAKYPERINHLVIADIAPKYYPLHHQDILDGLNALDFETLKSRKEADDELANYIQDEGVRMFLLKNLYRVTKDKFGLRINLEVLTQHVEEIGVALSAPYFYQGKTLFLKGEKSNYIQSEDEERIKNQFPNATIEEISNAGHWLHAENPKEFLVKTLDFVRKAE